MASSKERSANSLGGSLFVGCIILGTGIGFATNNVPAGSSLGVGVGFIVMAFARYYASR